MTAEHFAQWASGIESVITALAVVIAGYWAWRRFGIAREGHPHIQFSADINFVCYLDGFWIVELLAFVENKGRARHEICEFEFDKCSLSGTDPIRSADEFGGQVRFPNLVAKGTWLTGTHNYFFIEPGVTAKYSYLARVPKEARAIVLHAWFSYPDRRHGHTAERAVRCPQIPGDLSS